jgi:hypothetical protein
MALDVHVLDAHAKCASVEQCMVLQRIICGKYRTKLMASKLDKITGREAPRGYKEQKPVALRKILSLKHKKLPYV